MFFDKGSDGNQRIVVAGKSEIQNAQKEGKFSFPIIFYLIVFVVVMLLGMLFYRNKENKTVLVWAIFVDTIDRI